MVLLRQPRMFSGEVDSDDDQSSYRSVYQRRSFVVYCRHTTVFEELVCNAAAAQSTRKRRENREFNLVAFRA
jgi:hypothetical protein